MPRNVAKRNWEIFEFATKLEHPFWIYVTSFIVETRQSSWKNPLLKPALLCEVAIKEIHSDGSMEMKLLNLKEGIDQINAVAWLSLQYYLP